MKNTTTASQREREKKKRKHQKNIGENQTCMFPQHYVKLPLTAQNQENNFSYFFFVCVKVHSAVIVGVVADGFGCLSRFVHMIVVGTPIMLTLYNVYIVCEVRKYKGNWILLQFSHLFYVTSAQLYVHLCIFLYSLSWFLCARLKYEKRATEKKMNRKYTNSLWRERLYVCAGACVHLHSIVITIIIRRATTTKYDLVGISWFSAAWWRWWCFSHFPFSLVLFASHLTQIIESAMCKYTLRTHIALSTFILGTMWHNFMFDYRVLLILFVIWTVRLCRCCCCCSAALEFVHLFLSLPLIRLKYHTLWYVRTHIYDIIVLTWSFVFSCVFSFNAKHINVQITYKIKFCCSFVWCCRLLVWFVVLVFFTLFCAEVALVDSSTFLFALRCLFIFSFPMSFCV